MFGLWVIETLTSLEWTCARSIMTWKSIVGHWLHWRSASAASSQACLCACLFLVSLVFVVCSCRSPGSLGSLIIHSANLVIALVTHIPAFAPVVFALGKHPLQPNPPVSVARRHGNRCRHTQWCVPGHMNLILSLIGSNLSMTGVKFLTDRVKGLFIDRVQSKSQCVVRHWWWGTIVHPCIGLITYKKFLYGRVCHPQCMAFSV